MSPLWCFLCLTVIFVNLCQVEAGKKSQEDVIVINNGGGGGCGGGAKTIVKTSGGKKKGKGKGGGHKIILSSSNGGKCGKEHKVTNIPIPIPVPHYEHHSHHGHHGWSGGFDKRSSASNQIQAAAMPPNDKGDRGSVVAMPMPFSQLDTYRMDMPHPLDPFNFVNQLPYGYNQVPYV